MLRTKQTCTQNKTKNFTFYNPIFLLPLLKIWKNKLKAYEDPMLTPCTWGSYYDPGGLLVLHIREMRWKKGEEYT